MGKKKVSAEPIKLNNGPLKSVTIGEINQNKHGWVWVVLVLIIFCGIIFFLPDINNLYQKLTKTAPAPSVIDPEPTPDKPEDTEKSSIYAFEDTSEVKIDNLVYKDISLKDGKLSFVVVNDSENEIVLDDNDIYFVLYDNEDNELRTVAVKGTVASKGSLNLEYAITDPATVFEIKNILPADYPDIELVTNSEGKKSLICTKGGESIAYTFDDAGLIKVEHTDALANTDERYNDVYTKYNEYINKYSVVSGIITSLSTNVTGLNFRMTIDYNTFTDEIEEPHYFAKGEAGKNINFILESELYDCN